MPSMEERIEEKREERRQQAKAAAALVAGPVNPDQALVFMQHRRADPPKTPEAAAEAAGIAPEQLFLLNWISKFPYPNPWVRSKKLAICWREPGPFRAGGRRPNRAVGNFLDSLMHALQRGEPIYPFRFPDPPPPALVRRNAIVLPTPSAGGSDTEPQSEPEPPKPEHPEPERRRSQRKRKQSEPPKPEHPKPKRKRKQPKRK